MQIQDGINRIIARRQEKAPIIREKLEKLRKVEEELQQIGPMCAQMLQNADKLHIQEDVRSRISALDANKCLQSLRSLEAKYSDVIQRFEREEICISVVGSARQGKSLFLQAVSQLNDSVIPAFQSGDCTGAASVIRNVPGSTVMAKITFLTESEMVRNVQNYLDAILGVNEYILGSFQQIRTLPLDDLQKKMGDGAAVATKFVHLAKYVDHFDEWAALVQEGIKIVTDESEIQRYVAQHNGKPANDPDQEFYYRYLAVKNVEISCEFANTDVGKIVLRDTIGLGDTSLGIKEKMLEAIGLYSDAAIIVRRPETGTGRFDTSDEQIYKQLSEHFAGRNMGKWLFWLINRTQGEPYGNNYDRCVAFKKSIDGYIKDFGWQLAGAEIFNIADRDAINNQYLPTVLSTLIDNIDSVDDGILAEIHENTRAFYQEYEKVQQSVKEILLSEMGSSVDRDDFLSKRWRGFYNDTLMKALKQYREKMQEQKDEESEIFRTRVKTILKESVSLLPDEEQLLDELGSGGKESDGPYVYLRNINKIRTNFTEQFLHIDDDIFKGQTERFKDAIVDIFASRDCGRLEYLLPVDERKPKSEWLRDLAEEVFSRKDRYSQFRTAFLTLSDFQMSVRGFLMHRIRERIDRLGIKSVEISTEGKSNREVAAELRRTLRRRLKDVCEELDITLSQNDFYKDPNRILSSALDEFYDRLNYSYSGSSSEDVEYVWRTLYRAHCNAIWMDEFADSMAMSEMYTRWSDLANRLKAYGWNDFVLTF